MNIMDEKFARTKWCPYRSAAQGFRGQGANCIASDCALWQWHTPGPEQQAMLELQAEQVKDTPRAFDPREPRGYCGLVRR